MVSREINSAIPAPMAHGVVFQLGRAVAAIEAKWVQLDDGSSIDAELVVVGINARVL